MHSVLRNLLLAGPAWVGLLSAAAVAEPALMPHSAEYKVRISVLSGRLTTRLSASDGFYAAIHRIEPTGMARIVSSGSIEETARFRVADDDVLPLRYTSNDTLTNDKTQADVEFDWDRHMLEGTVEHAAYASELDGVVHDRVSIQYQLMHDLLTGEPADTYVLYDIDEFKTLEIARTGTKEIKVPAGRFRAVGIQHRATGSSRVTTLWCAEELDYLPVVIEQHRNGELRLRATLASYRPATGPTLASGQADR